MTAYRLQPSPDLPHVCPYCSIPTSKPKGHTRCVALVAKRWRYALSREQRHLGRYVGRYVAGAIT